MGGEPKSVALKTNLRYHASTVTTKDMQHRGAAAGIPSTFVSNVTARNQFSQVMVKPNEEDRFRNRNGSNQGSNSSPYQNRQGEQFEHVARHRNNRRKDLASWDPVKPFNRFTSTHNLQQKRPDSMSSKTGVMSNLTKSRHGNS